MNNYIEIALIIWCIGLVLFGALLVLKFFKTTQEDYPCQVCGKQTDGWICQACFDKMEDDNERI